MKKYITKQIILAIFMIAAILGFSFASFAQTTPTLKQVTGAGNVSIKPMYYSGNTHSLMSNFWLADKKYVDSMIIAISGAYLPLAGTATASPLTGPIQFSVGTTALWQDNSTGNGFFMGTADNRNISLQTVGSTLNFGINGATELRAFDGTVSGRLTYDRANSLWKLGMDNGSNTTHLRFAPYSHVMDIISTYNMFAGLGYESTTAGYVLTNQNQYSLLHRAAGDARWLSSSYSVAPTSATSPLSITTNTISLKFNSLLTTTSGSLTIANTAVTPGTYSLSSVTVDAQGRITSASSGSAPASTFTINGTNMSTGNAYTVTASAGTLTGTTLNSSVVTSSLTSAGTFTAGGWQGAKIGLAYGGTNSDLSATGGASQVLKQASSGAAITVGQLSASDLSNGVQGTGSVVLSSGASLTSPTITTGSLGSSTATTQSLDDNSTKVATTAYADVEANGSFTYFRKSGIYYTFPYTITSIAATVAVGYNGFVGCYPIPVGKSHTITSVSMYISTAAAASNIRLALYADNGSGYPSTLIEGSGNISSATTGLKTFTLSTPYAVKASAGVIWVAYQISDTNVGVKYPNTAIVPFDGIAQPNQEQNSAYSITQAFGLFPSPFTGGATLRHQGYMAFIYLTPQ